MSHTLQTSARPRFDAGLAYWEQRDHVAAASDLLRRLLRLVGRPTDLTPFQWGQLFAAAIDFAPSLILELGRGCGNSTCVFTTAAAATEARVVSVCLSDAWRTATRGRVAGVVPPAWLARLDAREADIAGLDFDEILGQAPRVLVSWDAHGYEIADHVLGRLLPAMAGREQLVLMHDLSDARHEGASDSGYGRSALWRGTNVDGPRIRLGHIDSAVEQAVAIVDFTSRHQLPLRSAAEDLHDVIGRHPFRVEAMQSLLGDLFALQAHWFHFSPNERPGPYSYPAARAASTPVSPPAPDQPAAAAAARPRLRAARPATAPAAPARLVRASHGQSLDVVVTGRADDHGGPDFFERLCAAARHNHRLLDATGLVHTFTFVEWNPVPGRPLLATRLREALPFWHRCWVVDPAWHESLSTNPRLAFMEFFAKNVGIRRSTADLVLTTNSDVFLSQPLVARLAAAPLEDDRVYRAVRHDVDRHCDWRSGAEAVLADPAHCLRVNALVGPEYANAAGDFLLLTRRTFHRLRGFNETVRFAKIHKDGQFCHRAWLHGLAIETLGPIWHLDHDGSYSNVGALQGAPDAPYGPEWDWRQDYRNGLGWGLAAAIEVAGDDGVTWLHHPRTHGPVLSAAEAGPAAEVADRLARVTGRHVLVNAPADLSPDEHDALAAWVTRHAPERVLFAGASVDDPDLGPVPCPGAPMILSRAALERAGDWPARDPHPDVAFWLAAGGPAATVDWPAPRDWSCRPPALDPARRVLAMADVGMPPGPGLWSAAAAECEAALVRAARLLAVWLNGVAVAPADRVAILGPDWATVGLLDAVHAAGAVVAGLYTADARQVDTMCWGHRVRALEDVAGSEASILVGVSVDAAQAGRLERSGFQGRVAWVSSASPDSVLEPPVELRLWRAAHADAVARGDRGAAAECLAGLAVFGGPAHATYAYDAAMTWEAHGQRDEALRLFDAVAAAADAAATLRSRARFHAGRLLFESGDLAGARRHLAQVLVEVPDHRRACEYLDRIEAAGVTADRVGARRSTEPTGRPRRSSKRRPPARA